MGKEYMKQEFQNWIQAHDHEQYDIEQVSDETIKLKTAYGEAVVQFTDIDHHTIVEFRIVSPKDYSVKFYLHFELNDSNHAKQLYDEMVETLLGLQEENTVRVLLSCTAGLTTSMFAQSLNEAAQNLDLDYQFDAVPYLNIYEEAQNYDVILIAPQIGYLLNQLEKSLPDKLVIQIPTAIFASYDSFAALNFIKREMDNFNQRHSKQKKEEKCTHCAQFENRILSIVLTQNRAQVRIYYRLYYRCEITDSNLIIKPSMNIYDLYDIIDTLLLKHGHIDVIGIATPGIVKDEKQLQEPYEGKIIDIQRDFEDKYDIKVFVYNNANAAVVGFSLEHPEYRNIVFHSQPFGFGIGGQGILVDRKIVRGKNGVAGELRHFIRRMQLSDEISKLAWTHNGALELVTKALLPTIATIGPDAVILASPMTPDMSEVKKALSSFMNEEFLPEFYYVKEASDYMLSGITELCVAYLEKKEV